MDANLAIIDREVPHWRCVTPGSGRFDAAAFRCGKREIRHRDRTADPPVTTGKCEDFLSKDRARVPRAGVKGHTSYSLDSYSLEDQVDLSAERYEILDRNYGRARVDAERRGSRDAKEY